MKHKTEYIEVYSRTKGLRSGWVKAEKSLYPGAQVLCGGTPRQWWQMGVSKDARIVLTTYPNHPSAYQCDLSCYDLEVKNPENGQWLRYHIYDALFLHIADFQDGLPKGTPIYIGFEFYVET